MSSRLQLGLAIAVIASVISCCFLTSVIGSVTFRVSYGNWPIGDPNKYHYQRGMTQDEIRTMLGPPHKIYDEDEGERWSYYCDAFGFAIVGMQFDHEGVLLFDWW
jgi:hypothetical protein